MKSTLVKLPTLTLLACLAVHPLFSQSAAGTGAMQVTVTNDQAQPIPGVAVQYTRLPKTVITGNSESPAPGEATASGDSTTDANGQISATGLPVGNYALCASVPGAPYLDPCIWQQPVQIEVVSGQTDAVTVTLTQGVFLYVQVQDPNGLLPNEPQQIWDRPKLLVGVMYGNGAYQGMSSPSISGAMHSYQMPIPAGTDFSLRLFSTDVAVDDAGGAAVDMSGSVIPFHTLSGQDVTYSFTVSGAAQQ